MKYFILISIFLLHACDDENPNSSNLNESKIYTTIEEFQNDPDWTEIKDIDFSSILSVLPIISLEMR